MTTSTSVTDTASSSLTKRMGRLAYRVLSNMTESSYQGFIAREGYRYATSE